MGAIENKEVVRKMGEGKGLDAMLGTMHDDVRWTIIGTTKWSGTMSGKQELVERLMKPIFVTLESPGTTTTDNVIAEGDYVVVQSHASGRTTKTGKSYNNIYCMVFKVIDSKIKEVTEYCDTELITAAFGH